MKLVIAEKPSVAMSLAAVLGATERKDGYLEGSGYLVSWCVGHLLELAQPEAYKEQYAKWRYEDLPILPENWKYEVPKDKKKQLALLCRLMKDKRVDSVVCATDAGREGLGTPATRAATLEKLVSAGFVQRKKKQLIPTEKGKNLIAVLPDNIKSPILTAEWESMLKQVEHGELSATSFMDQIADMSRTLVKEHTTPEERFADLFPSSRGTAHEAVGVCPRCGAPVYEGKKGFFCDNRECSFALWKDNRFFSSKKKSITKSVAAALLKEGRISMSGLYSEKTGKTYDAEVILDDTGGKYVNFKLEFPVKKGRRK